MWRDGLLWLRLPCPAVHCTAAHSVVGREKQFHSLTRKHRVCSAAALASQRARERERRVFYVRNVRPTVRSAVLIFFDDRPPDARKVIKVTAALGFPDFLALYPRIMTDLLLKDGLI